MSVEEDFPDWENHEEIPPEKLQKKWDSEEMEEKPAVTCSSCKKRVPASSFKCIYCGNQVFKDSGLLGTLLKWFRGGR
jgi:hypothetical protein